MPRDTQHVFETTVFEPELHAEGGILSIPSATVRAAGFNPEDLLAAPLASEYLGVRLGVPVPTPEDITDVFFASLAGRVVPFDDFSFERWRAQRLERAQDRRATFAVEFAQTEWAVFEESPLAGSSLTTLAARGTAWAVGLGVAYVGHPVEGLGVVILGEFGLVLAAVSQGFRDEAYLWSRYHSRRLFERFGKPPDWKP